LSDKVWIEAVINYIIGVAVISFIPLFFALFVLFGAIFMYRRKTQGVVKIKNPSKAIIIGVFVCFGSFFVIGLISAAGANFAINNISTEVTNVGDLAKKMSQDAINIGNTMIHNVQDVYDSVADINHTIIDSLPDREKCLNYMNCVKNIFGLVNIVKVSIYGNITEIENTTEGIYSDTKSFIEDISFLLNSFLIPKSDFKANNTSMSTLKSVSKLNSKISKSIITAEFVTSEQNLFPGISKVANKKNINSTLLLLKKVVPLVSNFIGKINSTLDLIVLKYLPDIKYGLVDLKSSIGGAKCIFEIIDGVFEFNQSTMILPKGIFAFEDIVKMYAEEADNLKSSFFNPVIDTFDNISGTLKLLKDIGFTILQSQLESANHSLNQLSDFNESEDFNLKVIEQTIFQLTNFQKSLSNIPLDSLNVTLMPILKSMIEQFGRNALFGNLSDLVIFWKTSLHTIDSDLSSIYASNSKLEYKEQTYVILKLQSNTSSPLEIVETASSKLKIKSHLKKFLANSIDSSESNQKHFTTYESSFPGKRLSGTLEGLNEISDFDSSIEDKIIGIFQTICDAESSMLESFNNALDQSRSFIDQTKSSLRMFSAYMKKYDSFEADFKNQLSKYTTYTSMLPILFGILPMILFIFVLVALYFKKLQKAKFSAWTMYFLVPLYLSLSVPFIFTTTLLGDHCSILSDAVYSQVILVFDPSKTFEATNAIKYFTTCKGALIDPVNFAVFLAGKDPNNIASFSISQDITVKLSTNANAPLSNNFQASTIFEKVESVSFGDGDRLSLTLFLKEKILNLQKTFLQTIKAFLNGIRGLILCSRISVLYDGILKIPCGYMLGVFGSLAFVFTFLPFIMISFALLTIRFVDILEIQDKLKVDKGLHASESLSDESQHSISVDNQARISDQSQTQTTKSFYTDENAGEPADNKRHRTNEWK
jgi:hypothetical protein